MARKMTTVGDHQIESGCVIDRGQFHAIVVIRPTGTSGDVSAVSYIFAKACASQAEAEKAAEAHARNVARCPEQHLVSVDERLLVGRKIASSDRPSSQAEVG